MALIVSPEPYRGRFHAKATELVKSGKRVGMVLVSGEGKWTCHVCERENPTPQILAEHGDAWVECPCGVPFVVRAVITNPYAGY